MHPDTTHTHFPALTFSWLQDHEPVGFSFTTKKAPLVPQRQPSIGLPQCIYRKSVQVTVTYFIRDHNYNLLGDKYMAKLSTPHSEEAVSMDQDLHYSSQCLR